MVTRSKTAHKAAMQSTHEISRREEILRKRFQIWSDRADDDMKNAAQKDKNRMARLEKKIARVRMREEEKIARQNHSKLFAHNKIFYWILSPFFGVGRFVEFLWRKFVSHRKKILTKRPHETFRMTPRAKTRRGIAMSGYFDFVGEVWHVIWINKWLFIKFLLLFAIFASVILGVLNQQGFASLRSSLDSMADTSDFAKNLALFAGAITGFLGNSSTTALQQVLSVTLFLYGWLTLVWLFRSLLNGDKPRLRDGLYNSGGAVLAMAILAIIILLQLIPFAVVMLAYSSLTTVGVINNGVMIENMAAWCALAVAALMTLYWLCSSLIALVIVTLPGVYPIQALRAAGDLVTSRRISIVLRLLMMALVTAMIWLVILMPMIWIDGWLSSIKITWIPLVPLVVAFLSAGTIVFVVGYVYMLYRRMVDDPTPPIRSDWQIKRDQRRSKSQAIAASRKLAKYAQKGDSLSDKLRNKLTRRVKNDKK